MNGKKLYKIRHKETGDFLHKVATVNTRTLWGTSRGGRIWYVKSAAIDAKGRLSHKDQSISEVVEYEMAYRGVVG